MCVWCGCGWRWGGSRGLRAGWGGGVQRGEEGEGDGDEADDDLDEDEPDDDPLQLRVVLRAGPGGKHGWGGEHSPPRVAGIPGQPWLLVQLVAQHGEQLVHHVQPLVQDLHPGGGGGISRLPQI